MKRSKRILAALLTLVMVLGLVACGSGTTSSTGGSTASTGSASTGSSSATQSTPTTPAEPKIMHTAGTDAASNACVLISQDPGDVAISQRTVATLYMVLPDGKGGAALMPALAASEPVDVNGDGLTWNIAINPDAMFENGEKITADTMVYTLKEALDPKLVLNKGSVVYTNYVTILNGKEYYTQSSTGVAVNWEDVGVKKVDDMTIQVVLTAPANTSLVMRHFAARQTAPIYQPLWEACKSADGTSTTYGSTVDKWISSGPFKLTTWVIGSIREFEKNENFIRADLVNLDGVQQKVVSEESVLIQMFDKGEIDYMDLTVDAMEVYGDDPRIETYPSRRVYTLCFNEKSTENPILSNENFRLALYYGTDRASAAKLTGDMPGAGLINWRSSAYADGTKYRTVADAAGYMPANDGYDPVKAKEYFDKALQEMNQTSAEVTITLISGNEIQEAVSQFLQEFWPKVFGEDKFTVHLDVQPNESYSSLVKGWQNSDDAYEICWSKFDLVAGDWDPIGALKVFTNTYSGRYAQYEYDELNAIYNKANDEYLLDPVKRCELAMEMEKYIIDHAVAVPVVYNVGFTIISEDVVLAVDQWDSDLGWGWWYADVAR